MIYEALDNTQIKIMETEADLEGFGFGGILGIVDVVTSEDEKEIMIQGLSFNDIENDIGKVWKTSRIAKNIFKKAGMFRQISFPSFYAIEVLYLFDELLKQPRALRIPKRILRRAVELLKENTWLRGIYDNKPLELKWERLKKFKFKPLEHQEQFLNYFASTLPKYGVKGTMLHSDAGTGKTFMGMMLYELMDVDAMVVFCPLPTVRDVWVKSFEEIYIKDKPSLWISDENKPINGREDIYIIHFDSMGKWRDQLRRIKRRNVGVWIDESHNVNELSSARTKHVIEICDELDVEFAVYASGTPIKALGIEAIPYLKVIDPRFTDDVLDSFKKIYGTKTNVALDMLSNRLGLTRFRAKKADVVEIPVEIEEVTVEFKGSDIYTLPNVREEMTEYMHELVEDFRQEMPFIIDEFEELVSKAEGLVPSHQKAEITKYRAIAKDMHRNFDMMTHKDILPVAKQIENEIIIPVLGKESAKRFKIIAPRYKYIELVIRGMVLGRVLTRMRIDCFKDIAVNAPLRDIIAGARKKTIFFTSYVEVANKLAERLTEQGFSPILVHGSSQLSVEEAVRLFGIEGGGNPLVTTYGTLSTGVPLTMASQIVMVDQPFRDYIREQTIARAARLGQDGVVTVVDLLLKTGQEKNLSTRNLDIMKWSQEMTNMILGGDIENVPEDALAASRSGKSLLDVIKGLFKK